jgi:hypothetical protein
VALFHVDRITSLFGWFHSFHSTSAFYSPTLPRVLQVKSEAAAHAAQVAAGGVVNTGGDATACEGVFETVRQAKLALNSVDRPRK